MRWKIALTFVCPIFSSLAFIFVPFLPSLSVPLGKKKMLAKYTESWVSERNQPSVTCQGGSASRSSSYIHDISLYVTNPGPSCLAGLSWCSAGGRVKEQLGGGVFYQRSACSVLMSFCAGLQESPSLLSQSPDEFERSCLSFISA